VKNKKTRYIIFMIIGLILSILFISVILPVFLIISIVRIVKKLFTKTNNKPTKMVIEGEIV